MVNNLLLNNLPHIIDKVCKNTAITIAFAYKHMFLIYNVTITIKPTTSISDVIFLNKPAGIAVHPSILHYQDSLSNGVKFYFKSKIKR